MVAELDLLRTLTEREIIMDRKNLNSLPAAMHQALQVVAAQLASLLPPIGELNRCITPNIARAMSAGGSGAFQASA